MKVALTIAGSDSGSGAGIQADLKTFEAHGLYCVTAITAVTSQNTCGIRSILVLPQHMIQSQLESLFDDFNIDVIKIGMLANSAIVELVADLIQLRRSAAPVVLDPVMVASSGTRLAVDDTTASVVRRLLPLSTMVTPNVREAETILSRSIVSLEEMRQATRSIAELGARSVVVTGGDRDLIQADSAADLLHCNGRDYLLTAPFVASSSTHGTGCTFSSAIAANLALGGSVLESVIRAKDYVHHSIAMAPGIGRGYGPMRHAIGYDIK
jgi:hydroxymethylpyrimidine/phosphomethylpyrimidine kinase